MYWQQKGIKNTEQTINAALNRAKELGISDIVVASSTGMTAEKLIRCGFDVTCVTYQIGFSENGQDKMSVDMRKKLQDGGINLLTTTHLMAGLDRACRFKFGGVYPSEIMANTLRMFGSGVKVCIEISGMALDAGLIPFGKEIIAISGSGSGADTAMVLVPAHSQHFFDTKIKEIICKPREF